MTVALKEETFEYKGWKITTRKSSIANQSDMEQTLKTTNLKQLPDMLFIRNGLELVHQNLSISFDCASSLSFMNQEESDYHPVVDVSSVWLTKNEGYTKKSYDWTFTTDFAGKVKGARVEDTDSGIDYQKLSEPEEIKFYDNVVLFEDELGDNGCSTLNVKIRVMDSGLFVLMRFYLRIDRVLYRVIDTRLYHAFESDYLVREVSFRESPFSRPLEDFEMGELELKWERKEKIMI